MYVILEARTQIASSSLPEGLAEWNRHGHRDGYIEATALEETDPGASIGYTLLPPYACAGHDPYSVVVLSDGSEYVSVHDMSGRHVTAGRLARAGDGKRRMRPQWNLIRPGHDGAVFVTFGGGLYRSHAPFHLEAKPHFAEGGVPVLDVSVRMHRYDRGGIFSFMPRQAHVLERIAAVLGLQVRTGSVESAVGLKVSRDLGAEAHVPEIQDYVSKGMGLPVWRLNSKGLRALADLRATHEEIHGGSTHAPLPELLDLMECLTGMNDPNNPVGPYEGEGWKWAAEEWRYEDEHGGARGECTEALQRRFVIERVRAAVMGDGYGPEVDGDIVG